MLLVHRSNSVHALVDALETAVRKPSDVFSTLPVLVHSRGLGRYLAMQLAQRIGICANVDFPHPTAFLGRLCSAVLGPGADLGAWSGDRLLWAFLAAIADDQLLGCAELAPVRNYLAERRSDRKAATLAVQVAGLFERYAAYRPELVHGWEQGVDDGWESVVWRFAAQRLPGSDAGRLTAALEAALAGPDATGAALPERVMVFSVATLPPLHVRMLAAVARHRPVHVYVLSPSRRLWSNLQQSAQAAAIHPLLASCGALARDFQLSLAVHGPGARHTADYRLPPASTVLGQLQGDLLDDADVIPAPLPELSSVRLHACHSALRQVQALRDALLTLFDELPDLQPRDVLVMAPDIERFAPHVHATFADGAIAWSRRDQHPGGLPRIPYRLADRGARHVNPVAAALLSILALVGGRLKSSEVLEVLSAEPVHAHFGIDADALPWLSDRVREAGIRWGADAEHRRAVGQPDTDAYTWRFGLDRLLLGTAMADPTQVVLDVLPHGETEGAGARQLLGGFVDFAETLLSELRDLRTPRAPLEWRDRLTVVMDRLVGSAAGSGWMREQVRLGLHELAAAAEDAGFDHRIDIDAMRALLHSRFDTAQPGQGFLGGAVTVCQLVPMRSIPFRVIALLGMDDGAYPRTAGRPAFDRMAMDRRVGDRSVRDDDRALFLEALLSAGERLVMLYTSYDAGRDQPRPPAVPVAELLDVLDVRFRSADGRPVREHLTIHHPLQPFSPRNFLAPALGHDRRQLDAARALREGVREPVPERPFLSRVLPPPNGPRELTIAQLCRFWQNPIRYLFEERLGLRAGSRDDRPPDREPGTLQRGAGEWRLRHLLLGSALQGESLEPGGPAWRRLRRGSILPLGEPGRQWYATVARQAGDIAEVAAPWRTRPRPPVDLDVELRGWRLHGRIGDRFDGGRALARAGRLKPGHELSSWIEHLCMAVADASVPTRTFGQNSSIAFEALAADVARTLLTDLVTLFARGQQLPLLFFPTTSKSWLSALNWAGADAEPDAVARRFRSDGFRGWEEPGHCAERILNGFPFDPDANLDPLIVPDGLDARALAARVWQPALQHLLEPTP